MSNEAQSKAMKSIEHYFTPKIATLSDILNNSDKFNTGDVVIATDTSQIYLKTDAGSTLLSSLDNNITDTSDYHKYRELDNQVLRCKSCGSVLDPSKIDSNNNVTCPYCNSVNHIFEKR